MRRSSLGGAAVLAFSLAVVAAPASAGVVLKGEAGFVARSTAEVTAKPAEVWRTLIAPALWWESQHTFSGDAANLSLDPVAGGCFCEKLPVPKDAPKGQQAGGVQHMRVVYVEPGKALRMNGALGPLQSEAVNATLTITIKPTPDGSRILFEYVVGGFMRYDLNQIGPAVDKVVTAQLTHLAAKLGPVAEPVATPPAPAVPEQEPLPAKPAPVDRTGKVWTLPPAPAKTAGPELANAAAPQPVAGKPAKTAAAPAKVVPAKATAAKTALRAPAKPAPKVQPKPEDKEHLDANAAFDAALGGNSSAP